MLTVFIEYRLDAAKRSAALAQLAGMADRLAALGATGYRCMEGIDQPGLFVESFAVSSAEQYEQIKAWRQADEAFCDCVAGGAAKLHVWAFRDI
ncbi:hypothetical protein ACFSO0_04300 [Brevibacillus sp. GCM10020057]|uniref:hypothetical protein n=1 Tax=Brevibacillus sp. GCM10020057 TaxID=3317327 RepID=UPI0036322198